MNIVSIGGSDPSGGAGIQSDVKTFTSLKNHCLTVITAITSQNTSTFGKIEAVSIKILEEQLDSVFSDFKIHGIKIGMVYNSQIIKLLYKKLKNFKIPIVIDPVIESTTGGRLIQNSAIKDFQKFLIPLATIITPNLYEAKILTNEESNEKNNHEYFAKKIQKMGAKNVVITGIETKKTQIVDFVQEKNRKYYLNSKKIFKINHGSGCNYSAALICALANKKKIKESVSFAKQFTYDSIKNAKNLGKGFPITDIQNNDAINVELSNAINELIKIKNFYKLIPECQTNFVFSEQSPKSLKEIMGISGRIVKTGKEVVIAGNLKYGGSKHVATALLTISKKFPKTCSAINIKYQESTIAKIKKSKLTLASYDRLKEPEKTKLNKSTIKWGIDNAIKNMTNQPDVIYHRGDFGKEPMILIFGDKPNQVLKKIRTII